MITNKLIKITYVIFTVYLCTHLVACCEGQKITPMKLTSTYSLEDVNLVVVGIQEMDGELIAEVTQLLKEQFSKAGMRLQNVGNAQLYNENPNAIQSFAATYDADLVLTISGEARERAGSDIGWLSYEAKIRATIYEAGGNIVVTKMTTELGDRSPYPEKAARSALHAAAGKIGPLLMEQLHKKLGQNVMTRRLTITGLERYASVTKIESHLHASDGINDVRLLGWDRAAKIARFIIYLQPAAKANLSIYLTNVPGLDVRISNISNVGVIGTERRRNR